MAERVGVGAMLILGLGAFLYGGMCFLEWLEERSSRISIRGAR